MNPAHTKPLLAYEIVDLVRDSLYDRWAELPFQDEHFYLEEFREEVRKALDAQIRLRGLATCDWAVSMAKRVEVIITLNNAINNITICFDPQWCHLVDSQFQAGHCERCEQFVPIPWNHDQRECDQCLVTNILEM